MSNATITIDVDRVLMLLHELEQNVRMLSCVAAEAQTNKARRQRMTKRNKFVPAASTDGRVLTTFDLTAYMLQAPLLDGIKAIRDTMAANDPANKDKTPSDDGTAKNVVSSNTSLFANP